MAPQVYTDNNRHDNIGHQHIVYDQHIVHDNKSEQVSLDGLGYIPTPRVPGKTEGCKKGEQGFTINNKRKWPSTYVVLQMHIIIFRSTWMSGKT